MEAFEEDLINSVTKSIVDAFETMPPELCLMILTSTIGTTAGILAMKTSPRIAARMIRDLADTLEKNTH